MAARAHFSRADPLYKVSWLLSGTSIQRMSDDSSKNSTAPTREIEIRVRYAETDQMGVVYHANYLVWCEMGRTDFIRDLGLSYAAMERSGVSLAVSELSARYHAPARYD